MASNTKIEWAEATLNAIVGCRKVSPGCENCYAIKEANRMAGNPNEKMRAKFASTVTKERGAANWTGEVTFTESVLLAALRNRRPTTYFVNSMSDLFYEELSDEIIDRHFAVFALAPQHRFLVLTKRPERMRNYLCDPLTRVRIADEILAIVADYPEIILWPGLLTDNLKSDGYYVSDNCWPCATVWLGVSVENQKYADERIPHLLETPAAMRFLSVEPMLGEIRLDNRYSGTDIAGRVVPLITPWLNLFNWVIIGGESGPNARGCDIHWIESIIEQCRIAHIPIFVKQLGSKLFMGVEDFGPIIRDKKGGDMAEWPEDLRIRQMPEFGRGVNGR